ncbi:hypothetical protein ISS30_07355 [bacterium]|nr:hypothetical protein [bacterium]
MEKKGKFNIDNILNVSEEENRLNLVKSIVDFSCIAIVSGIIKKGDLQFLQDWTHEMVMPLILGEERKYRMIYESRLNRLAQQFGCEEDDL